MAAELMNRAKELLKPAAVTVLGSRVALAPTLRKLAARRGPIILNLHRVADRSRGSRESMDPSVFGDLVSWLLRTFTITTFAELSDAAGAGRPPLVLSFDDGYRDFADNAAPILAHYGVAANLNVIVASIESGRPPATVLVQDFISGAPASLLREVQVAGLPAIAPDKRTESGRLLAGTLKRRSITDQHALIAELEPYFERFDGFRPTPMLTAADIRELAEVHEIGAHSIEHATMTVESDDYVRSDALRSGAFLERLLGARPIVYAFPNGVGTLTQASIVHDAGFKHVLLAGGGITMRRRGCTHGGSSTAPRVLRRAFARSGRSNRGPRK
jgi:peptidoglycan/xylan/chitin deacetylase (PgdA/CDA1 family)